MLKFRCKNCDQKIGVPDDWRGHIVRCPRCKQGVDVPKNAELVNKPPPAPRSSNKPAAVPVVAPARGPQATPAPAPIPAVVEAPTPIPVAVEPAVPIPIEPPIPVVAAPKVVEPERIALVEPSAPIHFEPTAPSPTPALDKVELPHVRAEAPAVEPVMPATPVHEPGKLEPVTPAPEARAKESKPAASAARAPTKPKKAPKRAKPAAAPIEPVAPVIVPTVEAPEPIELVALKSPDPAPVEMPAEPAATDPSIVVVTVARRDEPEPTLSDPATGNVVNIAEVLTQSVVTPKPIVTEASAASSDFASVFSSGAAPDPIPPMIDAEPAPEPIPVAVNPVEPTSKLTSPEIDFDTIVTTVAGDPFTAFTVTPPQEDAFAAAPPPERNLSQIVDVLPSEDESADGASAATDLLDTLSRTAPSTPSPDGPQDVLPKPVAAKRTARVQKPSAARQSTAGIFFLALLAMLAAAGSLGMCVTHSHANFAVPAGVAGLLIAVLATALAQGRSIIATITGIGAAVASVTAIAIGVLIGIGVLPGSTAYARMQLAKHLPTARAGDVEVRVRSASVVRPVLVTTARKLGPTAQTATQTVLRVEVELKNVSNQPAQYASWAVPSSHAEPVLLQDEEGNSLKPLSAAGAVPPGRSGEVVTIQPNGGKVGDVLLFEAPPTQARELDLQLPGNNIGSVQPLQLHIPAEMFARQ